MRVGDVLDLPPEPPVGTELKCRDGSGTFRLRREERGWHIAGTRRHFGWQTVCELWLPAEIMKLPEA